MRKIFNLVKSINWGSAFTFYHFLNIFLMLIAFSLPFIGASFSSDAKFEEVSNYVASRVSDSTVRGEVMAITVVNNTSSASMPDPRGEFGDLYGVFKQTNATFCSGYNIKKNNSILFEDIITNNLAIIYTGADVSTKYNGHYKHTIYPIELMFETPRLYDISSNMIYISQSQADEYLEFNGIQRTDGKYLESDYYGLIKQTFNMVVDGKSSKCVICNVYYEFNYYYEAINECVGEFVMCAYYNPSQLPRENVYFLRNKAYQTSFFMKHINTKYSSKNYHVNLLKNNIINDLDEYSVTRFYYEDFTTQQLFVYVFIVLSIMLMCIVCLLTYLKCWHVNFKYFLATVLSFIIPYVLFFIIYHLSCSSLLFSNFGIQLYIYLLIFFVSACILMNVATRLYNYFAIRKKRK